MENGKEEVENGKGKTRKGKRNSGDILLSSPKSPEFSISHNKINIKENMFLAGISRSFGIILFELLTGKRLSPSTDSSDSINGHLMKYISKNFFTDPADFYDAIDDSIMGKGFDDKILRLLEVACDCVKTSLKQRPKMVDIHQTIRAMWEGYKPCFHSESLTVKIK
ncbi:probably inactive leucine-rich repeat receptor-like protein kinase At5g48380 [Vigna angularis]|uniref:probably inactive leucine-rich repeat receptor-like protein kinase At5g48380 n=1 Tax=Phaseolus angularis TaxID=3914 RepID=UPI0022B4B844|nr:probably inactive leucine-rich repeat receptor-like protein kinase At5g48380 [Vigna angularis]